MAIGEGDERWLTTVRHPSAANKKGKPEGLPLQWEEMGPQLSAVSPAATNSGQASQPCAEEQHGGGLGNNSIGNGLTDKLALRFNTIATDIQSLDHVTWG